MSGRWLPAVCMEAGPARCLLPAGTQPAAASLHRPPAPRAPRPQAALFEAAAQASPQDPELFSALGVVYNLARQYDDAVEAFRWVLACGGTRYGNRQGGREGGGHGSLAGGAAACWLWHRGAPAGPTLPSATRPARTPTPPRAAAAAGRRCGCRRRTTACGTSSAPRWPTRSAPPTPSPPTKRWAGGRWRRRRGRQGPCHSVLSTLLSARLLGCMRCCAVCQEPSPRQDSMPSLHRPTRLPPAGPGP